MIYLKYSPLPASRQDGHARCWQLLEGGLAAERDIALKDEAVLYNRWGKPSLQGRPDVYFNLSHRAGLAACAVARLPVGIDAERVRHYDRFAAKHACTEAELAAVEGSDDPDGLFFRLWTLKESCVKAFGMGLSYPMKRVSFVRSGDGLVCLHPPGVAFRSFLDGHGYAIAVCLLSPTPLHCTGGSEWANSLNSRASENSTGWAKSK